MPKKLTDDEKMKAIASVWSNENKLQLAKYVRDNSPCSPGHLINATKQTSTLISRNLKDMIKAGVLEKAPYSEPDNRQKFYRMTDFGRKVLSILD